MKFSLLPARLSSVALFLSIPSTFTQNYSQLFSKSTTCDATCQQLVATAATFETSAHAHTPLDDFYTIPSTFNTSLKPGTLLKVESHTDLTNYTVPSSLTMSRMMYTSYNINGTIVPVSAFILWPYAPYEYRHQNGSKFPLVAWSHGTSGFFPNCAPSNYRSLQYNFMTSYPLALEGIAVVATDYSGLGVTIGAPGEQTHEWLAGPAGADDVAYAVQAARSAFPDQLDAEGPFVAMGHSQGGNVAWAFAERQAKTPVPGYKGTISVSPPTRILSLADYALSVISSTPPTSWPLWAPVVLSLQPAIVATITTVFPSYNYSGMTSTSYDRWVNIFKPSRGCLPADSVAFVNVTLDQLARPGWNNESIPQQWQQKTAVSGLPFAGPLMVINGDNDVVPVDWTEQSVQNSCQASGGNQSLELYTYQAMEHFPVIQASRSRWMKWIKDRLDGHEVHVPRKCGKNHFMEGFNTNYTLQFITPNWLVDWVPPAEAVYELSL